MGSEKHQTLNGASVPGWKSLCSAFIIYCWTRLKPAIDTELFGPLRDQLTVTGVLSVSEANRELHSTEKMRQRSFLWAIITADVN